MKNEDAIAEFVLKETEIKEGLRRRINESALDYYTGRNGSLGLVAGLCLIGGLSYLMFGSHEIPFWGFLGLAVAMAALFEARRNSGRVDAIIRLSELEGRDGEQG